MTRAKPILAVLAAVALSACGAREAEPVAPPAAVGARLVVLLSDIADTKPVSATLTTRDQAEARARISGVLSRLTVKAGDLVHKGQVIGVVTDARLGWETAADAARTQAAAAEASRSEAELSRTRDLYDHGVYAKARLEQVQAAHRAAASTLAAARAQQSASAELAAQGAILAPADGRVLLAPVPTGSVVQAGQSVATITAGPPILRLEIPEAEGIALGVGQTVRVDPGVVAGGVATIDRVYPAVTQGQMTADLTAPGLTTARIGMAVAAELPVARRRAVLVPSRFVQRRFGVDYVRVLDWHGRVQDVAVQTAERRAGDDRVEILSGVGPGDTVVASTAAAPPTPTAR